MLGALVWGAVAASSLVIGACLGMARRWPDRVVGAVLAFGAGALISAVSFDLAAEGFEVGGGQALGIGLGAGATTYFFADRALESMTSGRHRVRAHHRRTPAAAAAREPKAGQGGDPSAGTALALGAFLDGIPEQLVLGIGLAAGDGVSIGLLVAIFISNLPEATGSASAMRASGTPPSQILRLWAGVAISCMLATVVGFAVADNVSDEFQAGINGFAAGALLVMLIDTMVPESARQAGKIAGLVSVLGFAVAAGLSAFGG